MADVERFTTEQLVNLKHQPTLGEIALNSEEVVDESSEEPKETVAQSLEETKEGITEYLDEPQGSTGALDPQSDFSLLDEIPKRFNNGGGDGKLKERRGGSVDNGSRTLNVRETDYLIIVVHGIGADIATLRQNKKDFKETLKAIQHYWFWEFEFKIHVEFIDWKSQLLPRQLDAFRRVLPVPVPPDGAGEDAPYVPDPRHMLTNALSDLLCFMTPSHGNFLIESTATSLNACVDALRKRSHGRFKNSKIILLGHSLGGLILHEILTEQKLRPQTHSSQHVMLTFPVDSLFMYGVPLGGFSVLNGEEAKLLLPSNIKIYNIYHPHDPIGFRIEPLFYPNLDPMPPPVLLPYWRNNGPREYIRWTKDVANAKKVLFDYFQGLTANASDRFKNVFGNKTTNETLTKLPTNVLIPEVDISTTPLLKSLKNEEDETNPNQRTLLGWTDTTSPPLPPPIAPNHQFIRLHISGNQRYGTHERRPKPGAAMGITKNFETEASHLMKSQTVIINGHKISRPSKPATFSRLVKVLGIDDEENIQYLKTKLGSRMIHDEYPETDYPSGVEQDIDVLSECELGGGLELPVRLDFQLQENTAEHYVTQLGNVQSHFNYWSSMDATFFLLKQITSFRPRVAYSEFLQISDTADKKKKAPDTTVRLPTMNLQDAIQRAESDVSAGLVSLKSNVLRKRQHEESPSIQAPSSFIPETGSMKIDDSPKSYISEEPRRLVTRYIKSPDKQEENEEEEELQKGSFGKDTAAGKLSN